MTDTNPATLEQRLATMEQRLDRIEAWLRLQANNQIKLGQAVAPIAPAAQPSQPIPPVAMPSQTSPPAAASTAPQSGPPVTPAKVRRPRWSLADIEQLLSGRGLAALGGLAILIGAIYFLSLAFTRGWIGPMARVSIGLVAGAVLMAGGSWFFERREAIFGHALLAIGVGICSIAVLAATRLYGLLPVSVGLIGNLILVGIATIVALRANVQIVAGYGLVSALAAPPLLGASATGLTLTFLATLLVGTTAIALYRSWHWLPLSAFILTSPQLASWLDAQHTLALALTVLLAFWIVNTVASAGDEVRQRRVKLHPSSASLLLLNAALLVAAGLQVLHQNGADELRGLFLIGVAAVHWAVGGYILRTKGSNHPWGLLVIGTGIAAWTMAIPIQLGGPVVAIAWSAEAVALAWIYARFQHRWSGRAALVLGALALAHLLLVEYPYPDYDVLFRHTNGIPFVNANGGTAAFMLLAIAVTWLLVKGQKLRLALTIAFGLLLMYVMTFELSATGFVVGLALLAGGVCILGRRSPQVEPLYLRFAALLAALGLLVALGRIAPVDRLFLQLGRTTTDLLFWRDAALGLGALLVFLGTLGWRYRDRPWSRRVYALAGALCVYLISVELIDGFQHYVGNGANFDTLHRQSQVALSILWAVIGGAAFVSGVVRWRSALRAFGLGLLAVATLKVFFYDLATLDATARVASFIGLGILLLVSSYVYQRLKPTTTGPQQP